MQFLLLLLLLLRVLVILPALSTGHIFPEYRALLSVKSSITDDPQSALSTWNASTRHCTWSGVTCQPSRRRVTVLDLSGLNLFGSLSPDLAHLRFLESLSVAKNRLSGAIPAELSSLSTLRVLNLSHNAFNGTFPPQLSLLKNLQVLDLYDNNMTGDLPLAVTQMPNLRQLHLGGNFFLGRIPAQYGQWEFLEYLAVSGNELGGPIPREIGNLTNLRELYLGYYNMYEGGIPPEIGNLSELVLFDAASCNLSGELPQEISRLHKLDTLYLFKNALSGPLSVELGNLVSLKFMDLSENVLTGEIPGSFAKLKNLTLLHLFINKLHGVIPEFIVDMPELEVLKLWDNKFTGIIPQALGKNGKLQVLDLSTNKLTGTLPPNMCLGNRLEILITMKNSLVGPIPDSLGRCESLSRIQTGHNFLNGSLPRDLFSLPNLTNILLQNNSLTGNMKMLPNFSINHSKLLYVDISNNGIHGEIPSWIWRLPNLQVLDLSHNYLETLDVNLLNMSSLSILDFHSNQLRGQLPTLPTEFRRNKSNLPPIFFSVSRNKFYGTIPTSLCNATIEGLDLSHNLLTGTIPQCLIEMSKTLGVLNLGGNNLSGVISDSFPDNCYLQTLVLDGNQLEGELPKSLARCIARLEVVDVRNNRIQDTFPCYLKEISTLRVLILRSNQFYGSINCLDANTTWSKLQIFDLASNHFLGKFPIRYFSSWKAMMGTAENKNGSELQHLQYIDPYFGVHHPSKVRVTIKGLDMDLLKILTIFTYLDLSCNNFDEHIPGEIGQFKALYALNLSHNAFTGQIPQALAKLSDLESLDLSSNKLAGEIPLQLADGLIFLSTLNLSFNHLVGKIPQTKQFATFPESSFEGNAQLCDFPLKEKCIHEELGPSPPRPEESHSNSTSSIDWDFLSAELGFIFGFGIFIGPLMLWKRWRKCYYEHVDDIVFKMFPQAYIKIENRRRQRYRNQGGQACSNQGWWD